VKKILILLFVVGTLFAATAEDFEKANSVNYNLLMAVFSMPDTFVDLEYQMGLTDTLSLIIPVTFYSYEVDPGVNWFYFTEGIGLRIQPFGGFYASSALYFRNFFSEQMVNLVENLGVDTTIGWRFPLGTLFYVDLGAGYGLSYSYSGEYFDNNVLLDLNLGIRF
jgi:hypothetical protein